MGIVDGEAKYSVISVTINVFSIMSQYMIIQHAFDQSDSFNVASCIIDVKVCVCGLY